MQNPKRILLVDDDKDLQKKYSKILKDAGYQVIQARDALDVVQTLMCHKDDIDLILLDIQMPEVDGRDVFEMIQDYVTIIPVMVFSVLPVPDQKLKIPRARDYFNKADSDKILLQKISAMLD